MGFFSKIKKKLDKLGDTAAGKIFRKVRDVAVRPALSAATGGMSEAVIKTGQSVWNAAAAAEDASKQRVKENIIQSVESKPAPVRIVKKASSPVVQSVPVAARSSASSVAPAPSRPATKTDTKTLLGGVGLVLGVLRLFK